MTHQFTIQVDSAMMKRAWHAWFFFSGQRIWTILAATGLIGISALLGARSGKLGTLSIVGLTAFGFGALLMVSVCFTGLRRSLSRLNAIVDGRATYTLTETKIEATSSLGSVSLAWPAVAELRRYGDLILLRFRGSMYSTLPVAQIPADALSFLVERCRSSGARMVNL